MSPKTTESKATGRKRPLTAEEIDDVIAKSKKQLQQLDAFAKGIRKTGKPLLIDGKMKSDRAWKLMEQFLSNLKRAAAD